MEQTDPHFDTHGPASTSTPYPAPRWINHKFDLVNARLCAGVKDRSIMATKLTLRATADEVQKALQLQGQAYRNFRVSNS